MKRTKLLFVMLIVASLVIFSCSDDSTGPDDNDEVKIADNTVVINDDIETEPSQINENSIVFEYDQTEPDITVGDILVGYNDTTAYLRKVTDILTSQGTMTVETSQATLDEVIEQGSFEWSGPLEFDIAGSYQREEIGYVHPAVKIKPLDRNSAGGINFSFNGAGINFGTDMNLEILSGSFDFTPYFDIDAEYDWGLQEVHAIVGGDLDFDILAELTLSATGGASGEIPLLSDVPAGSPIYIQAGYLPIVIYPEFDLFLGVAVTSTGSVTLTGGLNTDNNIEAGFQWTDSNGFETIYEKDLDGNIYPVVISTTTEQTTRVYLKPRLSFMIYSAVGPHIALEPYIGESGIERYDEYCTEWLLGITGEVGANIDILGYSVSAGLDLPDYNTTIDEDCEELQENTPPEITSLSADPSSIAPNGTSTIICEATDADGDNLNYNWSATGGSISGSGSTVTYIAPSTDGTYTITCTVNDGNGGEDSGTVNVTVSSGGTGTVTDIDGNVYQTIIIGTQEWMMENLKVTHYRDGTAIPTGHSNSDWSNLSTGAYAVYNDDESNADTYGYLYNWYAVDDSRNIAPEGWHVPTDDEWKTLEMYLGMSQGEADNTGWRGTNEGSKLAGNADLWNNGNLENNAEFGTSGFTALPGGYRSTNGYYYDLGSHGSFWSSTEDDSDTAWYRGLYYSNSGVARGGSYKLYGFSVRCVRD